MSQPPTPPYGGGPQDQPVQPQQPQQQPPQPYPGGGAPQPSGQPGQPGQPAGQPYPGQPGGPYAGQQPQQPQQPGPYAQQPGQYPQQPGQYPQQPGQQYPGQPGQQYPQQSYAGQLSPDQAQQYASLAHLLGFLFLLPSLIIFLVYKDQSQQVREESRKALNFQITMAIIWVAIWVLNIILALINIWFVGGLLSLAAYVFIVICSILGFNSVRRGQPYKYPFSFDFVK